MHSEDEMVQEISEEIVIETDHYLTFLLNDEHYAVKIETVREIWV